MSDGKSTPYVRVPSSGSKDAAVEGVENDEGVGMLVSDVGRATLPIQSFPVLSVTTTANPANLLNTSQADVSAKRGFLFKADASNTGTVFFGGSSVNAAGGSENGIPLSAGESMFIEITRLSALWVDASTGTQKIYWLAI